MQAVVMAGGKGTRLHPLTTGRPKPMVPIVNRPILEHIVNLLRQYGFRSQIITLYFMPDMIQNYFQDGTRFGVDITYLVEEKPLGTAGGVKKVEHMLDGTFVVLSGDVLTDINLSKALRFHRGKGALATVVLTKVPNPIEYGIVIVNEEGAIQRFLEKPGWGEVFSDTINTGIYILEPEVLKYIEPGKPFDFSKQLFPELLRQREPIYGYVADGYWCDIGNPVQYLQANQDALRGIVKVDIPGHRRNGVWIDSEADVHNHAEVKPPALIGRGSQVRMNSTIGPYTVIGEGVTINEGATVKRSVIWNNSFIGSKADLVGCVVGEKCLIRDAAILLEGSVVGDECAIGRRAMVKSGIRIWPGKVIEAGAIVRMNLKWGMRWMTTLFGVYGITGLANIEITPEFASKLGVAFGSFLGKGARVVVGRDTHRASRMVKRALIAGLTSSGVNVYNLRICPAPVTRYMIHSFGADAGVMVRTLEIDPRSVSIQFYDSNGMELDRLSERRVEGIFFKEEFRRVLSNEVGDIIYPARIVDLYREELLKAVDWRAIRRSGFSVVIDCANGAGSVVAPSILGELGCQVTTLNARLDEFAGPRTFEQAPLLISDLARVVRALNADIGIALDADADRAMFVDDQGNVLSGDSSLALLAREVVKERGGGKVVVPVSASRVIDQMIQPINGKVIRCRVGARPLLDAIVRHQAVFGGEESGGFVFPDFQNGYDGIFAAAKIVEIMARRSVKLSALYQEMPSLYMIRQTIPCPWELRGRIMRELIEDFRDQQIDTIDGIKIFYDDSWILMRPSSDEPVIYLYAEAPSEEAARSLIREYVERVRELMA